MLLLTILSIGWMAGFIWIVVAGTAKYENYMYAVDSVSDVPRQTPLPNASEVHSTATTSANMNDTSNSKERNRFGDYPRFYEFPATEDLSCPSSPQEIDFRSPNWKRMCECAKEDVYCLRIQLMNREEKMNYLKLWEE